MREFREGDRVRIIGAPFSMNAIDEKVGVVFRAQYDSVLVEVGGNWRRLYFPPEALELEVPRKVVPLPLP